MGPFARLPPSQRSKPVKRAAITLLTLAAVGATLAIPASADPEEPLLVGTWRGEIHGTHGRYAVEQTFHADGTMQTRQDYASGLRVRITGRWKMLSSEVYRQHNDHWSPKEWRDGPVRFRIHFRWAERHRVRFHGSSRIRIDRKLTLRRVR